MYNYYIKSSLVNKNKLETVFNYKPIFVLLLIFSLQQTASQANFNTTPVDYIGLAENQKIYITGKITDEEGVPMLGVNIQVKGGGNRAISDQNGNYRIEVPQMGVTLVYSYIGFAAQEYKAVAKVRNIVMKATSKNLDGVVVIGYGAVKKEDLTGSVGQVDMKDLLEAPVGSFDGALAGRVAGVQVSSSDGQPGGAPNIVIRGAGSLTQSTTPLYVIDGFPIEDPDNAAINPEEIESMNILKDASATAIYGSRGANGVIIIQTKKGKIGKPVITVNSSVGFNEVPKTIEMMTPWEFVNLQMEIYEDRTREIYMRADLDPSNASYDPNGRTFEDYRNMKGIDWQNLMFRKSLTQIHNIAVRGGNRNTKYSLSGSIFDQNGIIINTGSKRYQGRLTIDQNISRKLRAGITANYSDNTRFGQAVSSGVSGSNFTAYALYRTWAYRPVTGRTDINLVEDPYDGDEFENISDLRLNPITTSQNDYTYNLGANFMGNLYAEYDLSKRIKLKSTFSISSNGGEGRFFYNSNTPQGSPRNRSQAWGVNGRFSYSETSVWSNENTITYNNIFNKVHKLELLGGVSFQEGLSESLGFTSKYLPTEDLGIYGLGLGTPHASIASGGEYGLVSYFGRLNYDYKSKYLFTATYRADGSSKFKKGNRFGFFPSAAFAWNMKRENFLKYSSVISESKIRVSYGETGNNRIGNYDIYTQATSALANTYSFGNDVPPAGIAISKAGNEDLKWETTKQFNVGYDLGFFNNRINMTLEYYNKVTKDLLLNADMPTATGFERVFKNIGSLNNNGFEITLSTINIRKSTFSWRSNFNISFNRNEVTELTRNQDNMFTSMIVGQNSAPLYVSRIGYPAGMFYGYIFDGIYQVEDFNISSTGAYSLKSHLSDNGNARTAIEPGHIKYKDLNGDGTIDDKDMSVIGRGQPIHTGGFTNNFSYKGFYLNIFFQWSVGNDIYNANRMMFEGMNLYNVNQYATFNNRWTPENRSNEIFKSGGQGPVGYFSDRTIEDGSYLRLKTVALSYSIPNKIIKPLYLNKLSLRVAAQNLLTFSNYSGMDPEVSTRHSVLTPGFDYSPYPQARTVTFGLSATF